MMPDKVYLEEGHAEPVVGFVGPAWNNQKDLENPIEYIRKDALLEWANSWLAFKRSGVVLDDGFSYAMEELIKKLNEM